MNDSSASARGKRWAVATPHASATDAAAAAFEEGGNAVDAAITAAATLAVAYPHMCGVGGDLFALVRVPNGQTIAINSSGAAPMDIDPDAVRSAHRSMPDSGPLTITVPGAVAGWATLLAEGGTLAWDRALAPAIELATHGVPVASSLQRSLVANRERNLADPGLREVFYSNGEVPAAGSPVEQPALAESLRAIATEGPNVLYRGSLGHKYAEGLRHAGSPIEKEDLARHRADLVAPLMGRYRDLDVHVVPPNSQGFALLEILAAIERMDVDPDPLGHDAGVLARLFLAVGKDRERHNADPRVERLAVATLLDDGHIASLVDEVRSAPAEAFDPKGATAATDALSHSGDTIALVTADSEGRVVSLIQSLYTGFGSGILEPSTGIVAHSRGACFTLDPGSRNVLAPGKRPAHTLMPVLAHRHGVPWAVLGTMGGFAQPQINASNILRLRDLGLAPDATLGQPRWLADGMDAPAGRSFVTVERDVPEHTRSSLRAAGFETQESHTPDDAGHAHCIRVHEGGELEAASDPRSDGSARAG